RDDSHCKCFRIPRSRPNRFGFPTSSRKLVFELGVCREKIHLYLKPEQRTSANSNLLCMTTSGCPKLMRWPALFVEIVEEKLKIFSNFFLTESFLENWIHATIGICNCFPVFSLTREEPSFVFIFLSK